ncbi:hypothetical protein SUDANB6_04198 [Streptomyces sp. enrichment culture]
MSPDGGRPRGCPGAAGGGGRPHRAEGRVNGR